MTSIKLANKILNKYSSIKYHLDRARLSELRELYSYKQLFNLAGNPNAPQRDLEALSSSEDSDIIKKLVKNPTISDVIIYDVYYRFHNTLKDFIRDNSPVAAKYPAKFDKIDKEIYKNQILNLKEDQITKIFDSASNLLKLELLKHPNTSVDILSNFNILKIGDADLALLSNPNTPQNKIKEIYNIRIIGYQNPTRTKDKLNKLIKLFLKHPNTPIDIIQKLSNLVD